MRFAEFDLDEPNARLLRNGARVAVTPKAFAILCHLASKAPNLVTKDELLDAVWGHQHLSESVLKSVISELRSALDDDARNPRIVETVSRRGYRFIGLESAPRPSAMSPPPTPTASAAPGTFAALGATPASRPTPTAVGPLPAAAALPIVGREAELATLQASWRQAEAAQRQLFWIAGEPGIGKTTLIDHFVHALGDAAVVARGQCVEQFGVGEPYMPVLEALGNLCSANPEVVRTLRTVAPTWLMQMPWLVDDAERATLRRELGGIGQERMVREFGELLERYAGPRPLLLITEDLHWSDPSTLLLLNHVARRRGAARVLWLASFRVAEVIATEHPLQMLRDELRLHRHCVEMLLNPFTEQELARYLQQRFNGDRPDEPLVKRLHRHTDGLPLFVVDVVEGLSGGDHGAPQALVDGRDPLPIPESLSALVNRRFAALPPGDRAILQAAAVCGLEFSTEVVAEALEADPDELVDALDRLVTHQQWLRTIAKEPAGIPRHAFRHALYRHVLYQRAGAARRRALHLRIGESLARREAPASELAVHFELAGEIRRAVHFGALASLNALRHFAPVEAMDLTSQALSLLARMPDRDRRDEDELAVLGPRAAAAAQLVGLTAPAARHAFVRMQWLGRRTDQGVGASAELGLGWMYNLQGKYRRALALARRVEQQTDAASSPLLHAGACHLLGGTLSLQGELEGAAHWLECGLHDFAPLSDQVGGFQFVVDPGVSMHARLGHVSTNLGQIARARAQADAAARRADALQQPFARVLALIFRGILSIRVDEPEQVLALTRRLEAAMEGQAVVEGEGPLRWLRGWAIAKLGDPAAGCALIDEGRRLQDALGRIGGGSNAALAPAVDALMVAGRLDRAAAELDAGLATTRRLGEGLHLLDLQVQQGRLALLRGDRDAARAHLETAWAHAAAQAAAWIEVQVLVELLQFVPSSDRFRAALRAACARLVGAEGTTLLARASAVLGEPASIRYVSNADGCATTRTPGS